MPEKQDEKEMMVIVENDEVPKNATILEIDETISNTESHCNCVKVDRLKAAIDLCGVFILATLIVITGFIIVSVVFIPPAYATYNSPCRFDIGFCIIIGIIFYLMVLLLWIIGLIGILIVIGVALLILLSPIIIFLFIIYRRKIIENYL